MNNSNSENLEQFIYCAVDKNNKILKIRGTTYFDSIDQLEKDVNYHNSFYLPSNQWFIKRFKLVESPENILCSCYHTKIEKEPRYNTITGQIDHYENVEYGICWGTKECDVCNCKGNKRNCDFYPKNRYEQEV